MAASCQGRDARSPAKGNHYGTLTITVSQLRHDARTSDAASPVGHASTSFGQRAALVKGDEGQKGVTYSRFVYHSAGARFGLGYATSGTTQRGIYQNRGRAQKVGGAGMKKKRPYNLQEERRVRKMGTSSFGRHGGG